MNTSKTSKIYFALFGIVLTVSSIAYTRNDSSEIERPLPKVVGEAKSTTVSAAFGSVSDSISIIVPPGRRNVEPHLSLSSNLNWQIDLGRVTSWQGDGTPPVGDADSFSYSLAGAGGQLVLTNDPNLYRAKLENVYREFRRLGNQPDDGWVMSNGEGVLHFFGSTPESRIQDAGGRGQLWLLDSVMDSSGNTMTYSYQKDGSNEVLYPDEIRYTGFVNPEDASQNEIGLNRIVFDYEGRPDTRISYNNKIRELYARRLKQISVFTGESLVRRYELDYIQNPINGLSLVKQVKVMGDDDASEITLRTIDYNTRELGWNNESLSGTIPVNLADDEGGETGARVVDVNGDGFADTLDNGQNVYLGDGKGNFELDAGWTASLQAANIKFIETDGDYKGADKGVRLIDVNSDGLPDLFIAQVNRQEILLNTGSGWERNDLWTENLDTLKPQAAIDPSYSELTVPDFKEEDFIDLSSLTIQLKTHLDKVSQFLWTGFDPNTQQLIADFNELNPMDPALPDALVQEFNVVINGSMIYDPNRFALVTLPENTKMLLEQLQDQNPQEGDEWLIRLNRLLLEDAYSNAIKKSYTPPIYDVLDEEYDGETFAFVEKDGTSKGIELAEVNGDGRVDILWSVDRGDKTFWGKKQIPIVLRSVFLNTGSGWEKNSSLTQKLRYFSFVKDGQLNGYSVMNVNGDNFADIVRTFEGKQTFQEIFLGTGNGWIESQIYSDSLAQNNIISIVEDNDGKRKSRGLMPIDFNDDGLVDYLQSTETVSQAYYNTGTGWNTSPEMAHNIELLDVAFNTDEGDSTGVVLADIDGDGLSDLIKAKEGEQSQIWLTSSISSGLMIKSTTALGEVTELEWTPSTHFDNTIDGVQRLPNPMPVVTQLTRYDGRGSLYKTTFNYKGGLFKDRQFKGFQWSEQTKPAGLRVQTWYYQDDGIVGQIKLEQGYDVQNQVRTERSTDYVSVSRESGKVTQFQLASTQEQVIDPEGNRHSSVLNTFDERLNYTTVWRNPDVEIDGDETTTVFSWACNEAEGIWSLPSRTSVLQGREGPVLSEFIMIYDRLPEGQVAKGLATKRLSLVNTRALSEEGTYLVDKIMDYDQYGNIIHLEDGEGNVSTFVYDETTFTYRTKAIDPEECVVECGYHPGFGELLWDKDSSGNITSKVYDAFGRLVKVTLPGDENSPYGSRSYEYSSLGDPNSQWYLIKQTEKPGGDATLDMKKYFDGMARLYRVEQEGASGKTVLTLTEYDDADNPVATTRPFFIGEDPLWTMIERDVLHRPVRIMEPDGIELTTSYAGSRVDLVDRQGEHIAFYRDTEGKTTAIHQWVAGEEIITSYQYDPLGRLSAVIDALGEVTRIGYNALGWRTSLNDPSTGIYTYDYDGEGRLIQQTAPDGQVTSFFYNRVGNLIRKQFPDGSTHEFTYGQPGQENAVGRMVGTTDAAGDVQIKYDARGNAIERRRTVLGSTYVTGYLYDSLGRIQSMMYPDGYIVYYHYDDGSNLTNVTDKGGQVIAQGMEYTASRQLSQIEYGNGIFSNYTYDELLRMTSIRTFANVDKPIQSLDYSYDPGGNILAIDDNSGRSSQVFEYDEIGRLVTAEGSYGVEVYQYDAIGNLLQKGDLAFSLDPEHPQRVIQADYLGSIKSHGQPPPQSLSIDYDENGNVIRKGDTSFTYDAENYLVEVRKKNGKLIERNVYDALGQRVILWTPNETTIFIDGIYEQGKTHVSRHVRTDNMLLATIVTSKSKANLAANVPHRTWMHAEWLDCRMRLFVAMFLGLSIPFGGWAFRKDGWGRCFMMGLGEIGVAVQKRPGISLVTLLLVFSIFNNMGQVPILGVGILQAKSQNEMPSEKRYYYHSNHLGSVNVVTDERARVVERREYKPYGAPSDWTGPNSGPREFLTTFNGQRYDDDTGLYYFGARHYDSELGRFLTADTQVPDPMNPKHLNRYAFGGGNPIRYFDPTGHGFFDWFIGIIIIVVVVAAAVVLTVVTCGALAPVSITLAAIVGGAIIGAGLGAAAMGIYALSRGASVFSSDFWMAMAAGAVVGAAIGAALAALPASLGFGVPAGAAGFFAGLAADVFVGAVLGGLGPIVAHLATGGGPEDILTAKLGYDIATGLIKGAIFGLVTGGILNKLGAFSDVGFALAAILSGGLALEGIWEVSKSGYAPDDKFSFLNIFGTDTNWFRNSPMQNLGIPSWAFAGTWAGSGGSQEGYWLRTLPLVP